jgi:large subunit ribosomal protein L9
MKTMKVLLRETVKDLGKVGDVVNVRTGYARNFLVPRKLAVEATPDSIEMLKRRRARHDAEEQVLLAEIDVRVKRLEGVTVRASEKAHADGRLYGSVSAAAIARLLTAAGHATEERNVRLAEPIKAVGSHVVPVHVHGEHTVAITVVVEAKPE